MFKKIKSLYKSFFSTSELSRPNDRSELLTETPPHPHKLQIHPTNRCNLRCQSCGRWLDEPSQDELTGEQWKRIVKEAAELGISKLNIEGGGEPLLRKRLVSELIKIAKNDFDQITGSMITNGTLIDKKIAKELVGLGWDTLTMSIDAPERKLQDELRGREGTFEKNLTALKTINSQKRRLSSSKPSLWFSTVISNQNYHLISDLVDFASSRGVDGIILHSLNTTYQGAKQLTLSRSQWEFLGQHLPQWAKEASKKGVELKYDEQFIENRSKEASGDEESRERGICPEPWYNMLINANGFASCCCFAQKIEKAQVRGRKLSDIWHGDFFSSIRQHWLAGDPPQFCRECNMSHIKEREEITRELREAKKERR